MKYTTCIIVSLVIGFTIGIFFSKYSSNHHQLVVVKKEVTPKIYCQEPYSQNVYFEIDPTEGIFAEKEKTFLFPYHQVSGFVKVNQCILGYRKNFIH
jgi:hypothetical protein